MHSFTLMTLVSVLLPLAVVYVLPQVHDLHTVAEWSEITYEFPSETIQNQTLASGEYIRGVGTLIDMDVDYGGMFSLKGWLYKKKRNFKMNVRTRNTAACFCHHSSIL